jgi:hypothetical protein
VCIEREREREREREIESERERDVNFATRSADVEGMNCVEREREEVVHKHSYFESSYTGALCTGIRRLKV